MVSLFLEGKDQKTCPWLCQLMMRVIVDEGLPRKKSLILAAREAHITTKPIHRRIKRLL